MSFLSFISPGYASYRLKKQLECLRYETALQQIRSYEGASKAPRMDSWRVGRGSSNEAIFSSGDTLISRSRDLIRNNPFAQRMHTVVVNNTIGAGIKVTFKGPKSRVIQGYWDEWMGSSQIDGDRHTDLYGLESLVMSAVFESGEVLLARRVNQSGPVPFTLNVLEIDYLDRGKNSEGRQGNKIIQGIEFNGKGERVAYWLYDEHPGDTISPVSSKRVSAENIKHIFLKTRPNQQRGVPFLHSVIVSLHELGKFMDATLVKQQISAIFSAFVYDSVGDGVGGMLGARGGGGQEEEGSRSNIELTSGTVQYLPQGKDIKFANPPSASDFNSFVSTILRAIASGGGVTYEQLTNDYSQVTFSSGRMGFMEMNRNITRWQQEIIVKQFLSTVLFWFKQALEISFFVRSDGVTESYSFPVRPAIDPSKEISATEKAIRNNLTTVSEQIRRDGKNPRTVFEERARELGEMEALGLLPSKEDPSNERPNLGDEDGKE